MNIRSFVRGLTGGPRKRQRLTLDQYQIKSAATDVAGDPDDPMVPLLGLGGEIGTLISEYKKKRRHDGVAYTGFDAVVTEELGDILWYLAALARRVDITLSEVADRNLVKTRDRWLRHTTRPATSFDDGFPDNQRFPRQFVVTFSTLVTDDGENKVRMLISGDSIGDVIDDNASSEDHYRFHDAFHLGYAAVLGWSPVFRALIKRKRRDDPAIDRVEDGARAIAAEEAVSALVFELAGPFDYFKNVTHVDDPILAAARAVTARLEVGQRTAADWEHAILEGFAVWRGLRDQGGGTVDVDLDARTVTLRQPSQPMMDP